jgi:drug/metabolite transporter (DMT)-like permease
MTALLITLAVLIQFLVAFAQYNMKLGARKLDFGKGISSNLKNKNLLAAVFLFLLTTVLSIITMRYMDFSIFYSFTALNYLFIMFFSWKILKEKFDWLRITGNALVIIGVIIFNLK